MLFLPPAGPAPFAPAPSYALPIMMGALTVCQLSKIITRQDNLTDQEVNVTKLMQMTDFYKGRNETKILAEHLEKFLTSYLNETPSQKTIRAQKIAQQFKAIEIGGTVVIGLVAIALAFRFG